MNLTIIMTMEDTEKSEESNEDSGDDSKERSKGEQEVKEEISHQEKSEDKQETSEAEGRNWKKIILYSGIIIGAVVGLFLLYAWFSGMFSSFKKPAIYLYPERERNIEVSLSGDISVKKSVPKYQNKWDVTASPSGLIDNKYDYLFFEGKGPDIYPKKGWCVKRSNLETFLRKKLAKMNFNKKETSDFLDYWLEELPDSDYVFISVLTGDRLKDIYQLNLSPKPDTKIRAIFYFRPTDSKSNPKELNLPTKRRDGFTVVEWGGILDS